MVPVHSSLGDRVRPQIKKRRKKYLFTEVFRSKKAAFCPLLTSELRLREREGRCVCIYGGTERERDANVKC